MPNPSFLARSLSDGCTAYQCRETGTRYIISPRRQFDCLVYRNGELFRSGPRWSVIAAIESEARRAVAYPH